MGQVKSLRGQNNEQNVQNSKRTRKKIVSQLINARLIALESPNQKYYERAYSCSSLLIQEGKHIKTYRCNTRTCISCNGVRTAAYIKHYGDQIFALKDPRFLTLTAPTVECHDPEMLRHFVDAREFNYRKIYKNAKKVGIPLVGMKSMEITTRPFSHYHIHFHFIIDGEENAEWFKMQWLRLYPDADERAQKNMKINDRGGLLEVFKYGTKFSDSTARRENGKIVYDYKAVDPERIDLIVRALRNKPLISCFGGIKKIVTEDVNEMEVDEDTMLDSVEYEEWLWLDLSDWYSKTTGEKFSDYQLSKALKSMFFVHNSS